MQAVAESGHGLDQVPHRPAAIRSELAAFLSAVEAAYGQRPILYVTAEAYEQIVGGHFDHHPLWVRNIYRRPRLPAGVEWTFWQYTNRGRLDGITGPVDLNVYRWDETKFGGL